jgi:hypothetical protein
MVSRKNALALGFISFSFVHANWTKYMPSFVKTVNEIKWQVYGRNVG